MRGVSAMRIFPTTCVHLWTPYRMFFNSASSSRGHSPTALSVEVIPSDPAKKLGQRDVEPTREMRERGERWGDTARLHLPNILPFEVDAAALVSAELRHGEPALSPQRAEALAGPFQQQRLAGDRGGVAGRAQTP